MNAKQDGATSAAAATLLDGYQVYCKGAQNKTALPFAARLPPGHEKAQKTMAMALWVEI